jgi:hypothetical protein
MMPARRSSRLKASNLQSKGNSSASDSATRPVQEQESNTSSNDKNGTCKRQRKAVINPQETDQPVFKLRGKRGKLRLMTEMPMDIVFEVRFNPSNSLLSSISLKDLEIEQIFGQLNPVDLLHLSWATKSLCDILMRCSAISTWKQAFLNLPESARAPPCPSDLNEAQYTNLLFGRHCSVSKVSMILSCIDEQFYF